jgi:translocon-associated protein subunit alpha
MKLLLLLLVLPAILTISQTGYSVRAEEDELVDDDEGVVEEDEGEINEETEDTPEEATEPDESKTTSADADAIILFTEPIIPVGTTNVELPAGQVASILVGFTNKGEGDMTVESLEASLRYPMDFTFHIQNFSAINYMKIVKPKQQATVAYSFIPADAFAGRPIGLSVNLAYRDASGNFFVDPVFNETIQIVEFDEGFDTETFFMYVTMGAIVILLLFLGFNLLSGSSKKKAGASRRDAVETGTDKDNGVDYEWIPKSSLRTPGSDKTSPRQRKSKRGAGSDTD